MSKIGKYFIIIGIFLIIVSTFIFIRNNYEEYEAGIISANVVDVLKDNFESDSLEIIQEKVVSSEKLTDVVVVDDYNYIGVIVIPSLNLELPVMNEYDDERLRISPVRYYGSVYTDNLIICAHSYKTHFGYLSRLQQEDIVIFIDVKGNSYVYEVLEIEVLGSNDIISMIDSDFDLTLYTCTSDGNSRITVRCNKVKENI